jgi:hypothetical protein
MANTQAATLIANVRARAGRSNDTTLITPQFVLDALNEGQSEIVLRVPRQIDMDKTDETTYTISTNDLGFDITTLDPAHIGDIWILNGSDTRRQGLKYMPLTQFRDRFLPVSEIGTGEPRIYSRQGNNILFNVPVSEDLNGLNLKIDYTKKATDFPNITSTAQSELSNSNNVLTFFALATCYDAMSSSVPRFTTNALKAWADYEKWLLRYRDDNEMKLEGLYGDLDGEYNYSGDYSC